MSISQVIVVIRGVSVLTILTTVLTCNEATEARFRADELTLLVGRNFQASARHFGRTRESPKLYDGYTPQDRRRRARAELAVKDVQQHGWYIG